MNVVGPNAAAPSPRRSTPRTLRLLGGLAFVASVLPGCIGQGEYDRLYETNRSLEARNAELQRERDEARAAADLIRNRIGSGEGTLADLQRQNAELRRLLDDAMADYRTLEGRMAGLTFGPLDAATDEALTRLAAQYPDLIKYDSARGMLRFASDLTFASGSAVVQDNARQALGALANVLKSPAASAYEVVIEGHTDSQRVSATTARQHPTNRHLSAHRAIAVIDELGRLSVPAGRMMAAGWGEHRPVVPNSGTGNTPQNRRVEIFLARGHSTGAAGGDMTGASTTATPNRDAPPERQIDITK